MDIQLLTATRYIEFTNNGWTRLIADNLQTQERYTLIDLNNDRMPDLFVLEIPNGRSFFGINERGIEYLYRLEKNERKKLFKNITHWKFKPTQKSNKSPDFLSSLVEIFPSWYKTSLEGGIKKYYCHPEVQRILQSKSDREILVRREKVGIKVGKGEKVVYKKSKVTIEVEFKATGPTCSSVIEI